jgi:hypothetical protein
VAYFRGYHYTPPFEQNPVFNQQLDLAANSPARPSSKQKVALVRFEDDLWFLFSLRLDFTEFCQRSFKYPIEKPHRIKNLAHGRRRP